MPRGVPNKPKKVVKRKSPKPNQWTRASKAENEAKTLRQVLRQILRLILKTNVFSDEDK